MTDLLHKLARNYSSVMEKILQAFSDIADVLPRLGRLKATFPEDTNFNQVVGLIYGDIIEFHQRAYKFFRRKAWHVWFAFDWGLFERRFKLILQRLELHCDLLDKEAAAAHFSEMKQFRDKRQLEEDAFEGERKYRMALEVFGWLSAVEDQQEEHLHRLSDNRQPETCSWVLQDPQVRPWIEDDSGDGMLWLTGIPGAGKSFLCSLLVENLQTQQHISTLYYFCSHQSSNGDKSAVILRTLARQFLQQNPDMAPLVHQAYLQKGSNRSGPAMRKLLTQVLPTSKVTRIVIDGIDEGDHATQQEVLKSLVEIQQSANHHCKVLISSRDEPQIQKSLAAKTHLNLGEKTVEGLSLYIKDRIKGLQASFPDIDSAVWDLAEQRLHSKAKGMFLWVRLVTDMLSYQTSEFELKNAIDQLPEGLDKAYGVIQSRIDSLRPAQIRQRAFSILYWVCVARRPISLYEVADGIVLHPGQTILNRKTRSNNPQRDIIELCAPLLETLKNGVLDLVHFSAREYFVHEQSGPFIDVAKAHLNIALSCVTNLTSCLDLVPRKTQGMSEGDLETRVVQGYYGLQAYGQDFWAEHVLAYLGEVGDQDADARKLIGALEGFSRVWKHHALDNVSLPSTLHTAEASVGLQSLRKFPTLHRFISGWLHFKSELNKTRPKFNTLDAQEQWRLGTDETFLSLIDSRLCMITERLLMMQASHLPSHIDEDDFKRFVSRFVFPCRFQSCNHQYDTAQERDSHEVSHALSFPCLQCDFSGRGFRSRKDLEKHTQRYHMSPEDFEIPDDLHAMGEDFRGGPNSIPGKFRVLSNRSGCWTERGRRALQQGFQHVLARFESVTNAALRDADESSSNNVSSAKAIGPRLSQDANESTTMMSLDSLRRNVEEQKYESLVDFKNDLSLLSGDPTTLSNVRDRRIDSFCDDELEKAMSAFPAFANFDPTASNRGNIAVFSSNNTEQSQGHTQSLNEHENDLASPEAMSFGTRVPYWSQSEEKQFPELLQRCGRDFSRIADHLKTKTPEEVDRYFVHLLSMGNSELSVSADLADARLQREAGSTGPTMESIDAGAKMQAQNDLAREDSSAFSQWSQSSSAGPYIPQFGNTEIPYPVVQGTTKASLNVESGENINGPKSNKRRPRPRALCPDCPGNTYGLRDEYALKKHIERSHTPTRKVWICEDISIDKRFLTKCKSCSASRRYSSKHNAHKHLRMKHFNNQTSLETLRRWMRETEEPNPNMRMASARWMQETEESNPNMRMASADSTSIIGPMKNNQTSLETLRRWMQETEEPNPNMRMASADSTSIIGPMKKKQKTRGTTISLPPLKDHIKSARTLPSMILKKNTRRRSNSGSSSGSLSSLDDHLDEHDNTDARDATLAPPEAELSKDDVFLEDISFDNFLPGSANEAHSVNNEGPPHRINRALIKPDQVSKLPNLNSFRKAACLDQVEALYYELDNGSAGRSDYQEALESLTSLSKLLMRNLKDWRRDSTLAMNIPFSF